MGHWPVISTVRAHCCYGTISEQPGKSVIGNQGQHVKTSLWEVGTVSIEVPHDDSILIAKVSSCIFVALQESIDLCEGIFGLYVYPHQEEWLEVWEQIKEQDKKGEEQGEEEQEEVKEGKSKWGGGWGGSNRGKP